NLADAQARRGRTRQAIASLQQAAASDPQRAPAYVNLIDLYRQVGDYPAAEAAFEALSSINANSYMGNINMGLLRRDQGRQDDAAALFARAAQISPDRTRALIELVLTEIERGNPSAARARAAQALAIAPQEVPALLAAGRAALAADDLAAAGDYFDAAVNQSDNRIATLVRTAQDYGEFKHREAARRRLLEAREVTTDPRQRAAVERMLHRLEQP
ncbi:MAG: tetratricopeptide repeat protein, partial [Pseudomonadota bacterium]|nr:tetratricopeptide repeat protein [Pseudomonadota bacterium]